MNEVDAERVKKYGIDKIINMDFEITCECGWKGTPRSMDVTYVLSERPRIFNCPECKKDLVHTAPHRW